MLKPTVDIIIYVSTGLRELLLKTVTPSMSFSLSGVSELMSLSVSQQNVCHGTAVMKEREDISPKPRPKIPGLVLMLFLCRVNVDNNVDSGSCYEMNRKK